MVLNYTTIERKYIMVGDSSYNMTGTVTSTFFPNNYIQNGEQVTFQFTSRLLTDKVVLSFDDFDIAPGGALYFTPSSYREYQSPIVITDESHRPVVMSSAHTLNFIFDNGWSGSSYRKYLGFKATYRFISSNDKYIRPTTSCGRYYLTLNGGHIHFKPITFDLPYDCVWVVKTQPGYKATYMKLDRFSSDFGTSSHVSAGNAKVEIHAGLTSNGKIVGTLFQSNAGIYRDYEDKEGFYIRLRGTFTRSVTFQMAFTSFMNYYTSGCDTSTHFRCSSGQCIPNKLSCDHIEHCKDGTDETYGCSGSDDTGTSHEALTVSVIIPMVVSIFLLIVLCILFVLVRRCRQARQFNNMINSSPGVCRSDRHRGRRRHDDHLQRPHGAPPTYDEALITGIPVPDHGFPDDSYDGAPKPPSYSEAVASPLMRESSIPSPPYSSREDVRHNQSFLDDERGVTDEGPGHSRSNPTDRLEITDNQDSVSTSTQTNVPYVKNNHKRPKNNKEQPSLHLLDTGRLPNLPSIHAAVGTQSMYNISDIGHNDNLARARSEQILAPQNLAAGIVNHGFIDDQDQTTNKQSRLYRGQAVSNLDLPTSSEHSSTNVARQDGSHPSVHHQDYKNQKDMSEYQYNIIKKQQKNITNSREEQNNILIDKSKKEKQSARDRLKPADPNLNKKYNDELMKRENSRKSNSIIPRQKKNKGPENMGSPSNRREHQHYSRAQEEDSCHSNNVDHKNPRSQRGVDEYSKNYHKAPVYTGTSESRSPRDDSRHKNGSHIRSDVERSTDSTHKTPVQSGKYGLESGIDSRVRNFNGCLIRRNGRENSDSNSVTNNHVVTRGSNLSLNLSAGHTNEVHRSSTSLNDNMMSRGSDCRFEGANNEINSGLSAGNTALTYQSNIGPNPGDTGRTSSSCINLNLDDIDEDIYV